MPKRVSRVQQIVDWLGSDFDGVIVFDESHAMAKDLIQVRTKHSAPETMVDECGHPKHAALHLKVTAISGCDGFKAAKPN